MTVHWTEQRAAAARVRSYTLENVPKNQALRLLNLMEECGAIIWSWSQSGSGKRKLGAALAVEHDFSAGDTLRGRVKSPPSSLTNRRKLYIYQRNSATE